MNNIDKIRKHIDDSKIFARTWDVKIDPYGMIMTLSQPFSDNFAELRRMMEEMKLAELAIDPGDSVLRVGKDVTIVVKSRYNDTSTFSAALHKWGAKIPPSFATEAAHKLFQQSRGFQDLADEMKSKAHVRLDSNMAKRSKLQTQTSNILSQIAEVNQLIVANIVDMIREEKMLEAVVWERPKDDGSVNVFRHDHCRELFPLTSLMGLVDPADPTIRLGAKARIVQQMAFPLDRPDGGSSLEMLPVKPALVAIIHTGSFLEAADFVKGWGIRWEEPKEEPKKG